MENIRENVWERLYPKYKEKVLNYEYTETAKAVRKELQKTVYIHDIPYGTLLTLDTIFREPLSYKCWGWFRDIEESNRERVAKEERLHEYARLLMDALDVKHNRSDKCSLDEYVEDWYLTDTETKLCRELIEEIDKLN